MAFKRSGVRFSYAPQNTLKISKLQRLYTISYTVFTSCVYFLLLSTFVGCANLEVLEFTGTLKVDTWLSGAPKLSLASLQSVIDSLADFSGTGTSKKITFGAKNKAKLSAAQLAQVTDKGWVLG